VVYTSGSLPCKILITTLFIFTLSKRRPFTLVLINFCRDFMALKCVWDILANCVSWVQWYGSTVYRCSWIIEKAIHWCDLSASEQPCNAQLTVLILAARAVFFVILCIYFSVAWTWPIVTKPCHTFDGDHGDPDSQMRVRNLAALLQKIAAPQSQTFRAISDNVVKW